MFQSLEGIKEDRDIPINPQGGKRLCFSPWKGLRKIATFEKSLAKISGVGFSPWKGLRKIATMAYPISPEEYDDVSVPGRD